MVRLSCSLNEDSGFAKLMLPRGMKEAERHATDLVQVLFEPNTVLRLDLFPQLVEVLDELSDVLEREQGGLGILVVLSSVLVELEVGRLQVPVQVLTKEPLEGVLKLELLGIPFDSLQDPPTKRDKLIIGLVQLLLEADKMERLGVSVRCLHQVPVNGLE